LKLVVSAPATEDIKPSPAKTSPPTVTLKAAEADVAVKKAATAKAILSLLYLIIMSPESPKTQFN
jgi:hypothetical protein